jgi:transcriptional regulator with PAS, ATPase and Fis domain
LLLATERLSVRGVTPAVVERELARVLRDVIPGHPAILEEIGSSGTVTRSPAFAETKLVLGDCEHAGDDEVSEECPRFELGDGFGRRLRLRIKGPLSHEQRSAVGVIVTVARLALEVSTLRAQGAGERAILRVEAAPIAGIVAASPSMQKLEGELRRLASSRATVILNGESGSGKEVAARALHELGDRRGKPFVAFNCAAVPRELFEAELFGYRKGSFTGATSDSPGVIRAADGGTLLLDEIGELPLELQPKLLRFLENGEIAPIGVRKPIRVDVRVVAATHRDLAALVREGLFREDLYYRLHVVPLRVAPLRERKEDILPLARAFAAKITGGTGPAFAPDAVAALVGHRWPGNVRELRNVIERALAFAPNAPVLGAEHIVFET